MRPARWTLAVVDLLLSAYVWHRLGWPLLLALWLVSLVIAVGVRKVDLAVGRMRRS